MSLTKQLHHWMSLTKQLHHWMSLTKQLQICDLYKIMGNTTCIAPQFSATLHHWSPSSSAAHNRSRASRHSRASSDCSHVASFCCRVERGCPLRAFRSWKRGNAAKLPRGSVTPQISHLQCTSKNQSSKTSSWGTTSQTPYKHQNV